MNQTQLDAIVRMINAVVEGDAFTVDLHLRSGRILRRGTLAMCGTGLVCHQRADFPPIYVVIAEIAAVELCG